MSARLTRIAAGLMISLLTLSATALVAPKPLAGGAATAPVPATFSFTGKITTGIMAIGGETTGTTISDGKTTYELDIKDALLKRKAEELNGKQATVKGSLTIKAGIEIAQRRIIVVTSLDAGAVDAAAQPK